MFCPQLSTHIFKFWRKIDRMADKITISSEAENAADGPNQVSPEVSTENDHQSNSPSSEAEDDPITALTEQLAAAEATSSDHYDRLLRVTAEFENYKKRSAKEYGDLRKFANESLLRDLLHVVDNLDRALETCDASQGADAILKGVELTRIDLLKIFERFSVEAVDAVGRPFDPAYQQAVMQEPTAEVPENTVVRELQKGYTLHGRLLRPAMVVVATAVSQQSDDAPKNS